mgnify:CR=1 FL=1
MANRLAQENSLYLRQHADNPVDWYPWGEEALEKARQEDKPLLVSIGYAACHWCHVMAHESFEDDSIAKLMNTHFVCVKVDREERPEIDRIYMDAVQMMNGQGGWPLNVFCLPDGRPFAGGTYFPPDERRGHGLIPWPQLIMRVADYYKRKRADLEENAKAILGNLEAGNAPHKATGDPIQPEHYLQAAGKLLDSEDTEYGGFGGAPKFPPAMALDFLLALRNSETVDLRNREMARNLDNAINRSLTAMAHGGLYDQIGGGFARYSVDRYWLIPHFEKMLYDNALLLDTYARAWQRYPRPLYEAVVRETVHFLEREMSLPNGAFAASLDADTEEGEGHTYLWTPEQVKEVLGQEEGSAFCEAYGITGEGNFEDSGKSQPALLEHDPEIRSRFATAREELLLLRNQRTQPARDEKALVSWNALLLRALARAGFVFGEMPWIDRALAIGNWIWQRMRHDDSRLHSVAYGEEAAGTGTLDDYAYSAEAFLVLASVVDANDRGASSLWTGRARQLLEAVEHHFVDPAAVGYFYTADDHPQLVHRSKEWFDNATPSGHSALLHAWTLMEVLTGDAEWSVRIEQLKTAYPGLANAAPMAVGYALAGLVERAVGASILKIHPEADVEAARRELLKRPYRPCFLRRTQEEKSLPAAYQICIDTQCFPPENDIRTVLEKL